MMSSIIKAEIPATGCILFLFYLNLPAKFSWTPNKVVLLPEVVLISAKSLDSAKISKKYALKFQLEKITHLQVFNTSSAQA